MVGADLQYVDYAIIDAGTGSVNVIINVETVMLIP
jgi:hypothetical protein